MTSKDIEKFKEYMRIAMFRRDLLWKHHDNPSALFLEEQEKKKKKKYNYKYYKKQLEEAKA